MLLRPHIPRDGLHFHETMRRCKDTFRTLVFGNMGELFFGEQESGSLRTPGLRDVLLRFPLSGTDPESIFTELRVLAG